MFSSLYSYLPPDANKKHLKQNIHVKRILYSKPHLNY